MIGKSPIYHLMENGAIKVYGEPELTFINSGNRPAVITSVIATISPLESIQVSSPKCPVGDGLFDFFPAHLDIDPFVLKSGEIIVKAARFPKLSFFIKQGDTMSLDRWHRLSV